MTSPRPLLPIMLAAVSGIVLWLAASLITGRREAWDASSHWTFFYPLSLLICALLGYFHPFRPWRWPLVLFASQFLAMVARNGEVGSLAPLGLLLFGILAIPGVVLSRAGARLRYRTRGGGA